MLFSFVKYLQMYIVFIVIHIHMLGHVYELIYTACAHMTTKLFTFFVEFISAFHVTSLSGAHSVKQHVKKHVLRPTEPLVFMANLNQGIKQLRLF